MSERAESPEQRLGLALSDGEQLDPAAWFSLGAELHQAGSLEAGLTAFERFVQLVPDDISGWHAVTALRLALRRPASALLACNEALSRNQDDPASLFNAAVTLEALGDLEAALHAYIRVLAISPGHQGALLNRVPLLARLLRTAEAIDAGEAGVSAHPNSSDAWFNLGEAFTSASRHQAALDAYAKALDLDPGLGKADVAMAVSEAALGHLLRSTARFERIFREQPEALSGFASPLLTDKFSAFPDLEPGRIALISVYEAYRVCEKNAARTLTGLFKQVIAGDGCRPLDNPDLPFLAIGLPLSGEDRLRAARQVAARIQSSVEGRQLVKHTRRKSEHLRIGYVCGDFRMHATSHLLGRLFGLHDRERFEVFGYSIGPQDDSALRAEVIAGFDSFVDAQIYDPLALAQRVALDGIDILVDLSGYTLHSKPASFALRPAPLQVSYLAYLQTSGVNWIDYVFLDRQVLTATERSFWQEKILYLPDTLYICDDTPVVSDARPAREQFGIPADAFVYCCLSAPWKIGEEDFALWMEVLHAVPQAVLFLYADPLAAATHLQAAAVEAGIDPERLIFSGRLPHQQHLERFMVADLFLDTKNCNAHTTAIEALAAGLPLLTRPGVTVQSRVAAGLLAAHGVEELVATSDQEYVAKAIRFSADAGWREKLRESLLRREGSGLFCTEAKVRQIERGYEMIWQRHLAGLAPTDMDVPG